MFNIFLKCDIGCDFKTTVYCYIKEKLKFASFLGVEGGGKTAL